jgi:DNA-directed RNA polymerase specialized sigma24 family protein
MKDNKILLEEVIRMIDMSDYNSEKKEFLKENIKKRYLKEDDLNLFDDEEDEGESFEGSDETEEEKKERFKRKKYYQLFLNRTKEIAKEYNSNVDISVLDKLLLTFDSVDTAVIELFNLQKEDLVQIQDLSTDVVKPEEEGGREGAVYYKGSKPLYKKGDVEEFKRLAERGRFVLKAKGEKDETIDSNLYKWLATRGKNLIKLTPGQKFSSEANAQLNFLARILSNKPKDEIEDLILNNNKVAKSNAFSVMKDYYNVVTDNIIKELYQLDSSIQIADAITDGVLKALYNLWGVAGVGTKTGKERLQETSWNPSMNVSPWIIQIVKNNVIDELKLNITEYTVGTNSDIMAFIENNTTKTSNVLNKEIVNKENRETIIRLLNEEPVAIAILSKIPNENHTKNITMVGVDGKYYKYIYTGKDKKSAQEKVLEDLQNGAKHLNFNNLTQADRNVLYKSERKESAPVHLDDKEWEKLQTVNNVEDAIEIMYNIDITSNDIRDVLENALNDMIQKGGVAGITVGTHSLNKFSTNEERELNRLLRQDSKKASEFRAKLIRRKKLAREMVINFMYNFLIDSLIKSKEKIDPDYIEKKPGEKVGDRGVGVEAEALTMWIEDQNNNLLSQIVDLEKRFNPNLTDEEIKQKVEKYKLTLTDSNQAIKNGLERYLKSNTNDLKRLASSIESMSAAGYDVEVGSEPILERKLRAKIQKILKERFTILKEEEESLGFLSGDINKELGVYKNSLSDLFQSGRYNIDGLTKIVQEIIKTGRAPKNLNSENLAMHKGVYNFIITMLASVYNNLSVSEKRNIISYIFVSAFPRGENSNFINHLMSVSKLTPSSRARDMVWDAVLGGSRNLTSIERALNNYSPEKKNFNNFLTTIIRNEVVDLLRKSKDTRTSYLEDPIGSSEEGDANTLLDKLGDESQYQQNYESDDEDVKKIANSLKKFMLENLSKKEFEMFLLLKDDSVAGTGRTGKTKFNISMAATALDISNVNARVIKSRLTEKLNKFIESGELREFILNETGLDISGYTKIQDYLDKKVDKLNDDSDDGDDDETKDDYYSSDDEDEDDEEDLEDYSFGDEMNEGIFSSKKGIFSSKKGKEEAENAENYIKRATKEQLINAIKKLQLNLGGGVSQDLHGNTVTPISRLKDAYWTGSEEGWNAFVDMVYAKK